jgi:hypothetical protein
VSGAWVTLDMTSYSAYESARDQVTAVREARRKAALAKAELARQKEEKRRAEEQERSRREQIARLVSAGAKVASPHIAYVQATTTGPADLANPTGKSVTVPGGTRVFVVAKSRNDVGVTLPEDDEDLPAGSSLLDVEAWLPASSAISPGQYQAWRRKTSIAANLEDVLLIDSDKVMLALRGDVLGYYDESTEYDTPLKQKVYKKTDEYREKRAALGEAARKLKRARLVIPQRVTLGSYNLKTKRFDIGFGSTFATDADEAEHSKCMQGVCFDSLPVKAEAVYYRGKRTGIERYTWSIKMSEAQAVLVENDEVDIYFVYMPSKVISRSIAFHDGYKRRTTTRSYVLADKVTVFITQRGSDELVFSQRY